MTFIIGQRWISNTESQLGLGIITDVTRRQVSLQFPAAAEERIYAIDNAPLSRIIFKEGDEVQTIDENMLTILEAQDNLGLIVYLGTDDAGNTISVDERNLNSFIKLHTPEQRLYSGLIDKLESYQLRIETLAHLGRLQKTPARGLLGARTNHLPHQIYIANEVAQRYAPRVLLADEVGLGKTIEAGLILHYQLHTGRASRVLILVPDSLVHQWLVEMIRRFNLYFSIFDTNRFEQGTEVEFDDEANAIYQPQSDNLFESEQLIISSIEFLIDNDDAREQALATDWDLIIVDEAHHLEWSQQEQSPEYTCVEELSKCSKGLLLLTATPEQVGIQSHFARLRLLDPSRFHSFKQFQKEEQGYQELNKVVQALLNLPTDSLSSQIKQQLKPYFSSNIPNSVKTVIANLIDRHGTGRVLFRNTRAAVQGFPERHLHTYPLESQLPIAKGIINLYPEDSLNIDVWLEKDPRVEWLAQKIIELKQHKVLVICSKMHTAIALEHYLKVKKGIRCSAFHQMLSIVERDRAAAYFAEQENGAQALICSEIGSEGRNFQFAHHLVLFDLPLNPDLLEQRIGRLDRIGQHHSVEIHVPYLINTTQETLFRWLHEGLNAFEQSCSIGYTVCETFEDELIPLLKNPDNNKLEQLIVATQAHVQEINKQLRDGRDSLLELNSCNRETADHLIGLIEEEENNQVLEEYMGRVFHEYAIDQDHHSDHTEILRPTEHMKTSHFPGLKEDGVTVTYSRTKALVREDMEFLSWEHPMVTESMDMILDSELGNCALATISIKSIPAGTLFLESFFTINCIAPKKLQLDRFLPINPIRILMDVNGKNLSKIVDYRQLNNLCTAVKPHLAYPVIKQIHEDIENMLKQSNQLAESQMAETVTNAQENMHKSLEQELERLVSLQKVNPAIRKDEIDFIKEQIKESKYYLSHAALKLQALRLVINN